MKRAFLVGLALAVGLVSFVLVLPHLRSRLGASAVPQPTPPAVASPDAARAPSPAATPSLKPPTPASAPPAARPAGALHDIGDQKLDAQIRRVVESMDRTGQAPAGVAEGGRRGGRRGVFENAERRLPPQALGYYRESDVWPRGRFGRRSERLIFGQKGEVWYSPDHYRSFARIR